MKTVVLGAGGMLGSELASLLEKSGHKVFAFDRELDVTDPAAVSEKISELQPEAVFNCAAFNAMDKAEQESESARALNAAAVGNIAKAAKVCGAVVVHYSTGYVFDGRNDAGYEEDDQPNPISIYGHTKYEGEQQLKQHADKYYLIRLNLLFGAPGLASGSKKSFPAMILEQAETKDSFDFVADEISTPTYAPDLARASITLLTEKEDGKNKYAYGIYHLVNEGRASWYDWAKQIFEIKGISKALHPVGAEKFPRPAARPRCSVLLNTKFPKLRTWQQATAEFLETNQ